MGKNNKSRKKEKIKPLGHYHRKTAAPASFSRLRRLLFLASWSRHGGFSVGVFNFKVFLIFLKDCRGINEEFVKC